MIGGPRLGAALAAVMVAWPAARAFAQESVEDRLRKQEERLAAAEALLRKQDEQIGKLTRALALETEEQRRLRGEVDAARTAGATLDTVLSAFRVSGFIQADAVLHRQSSQNELSPTGQPLNQDRFSIPRAHLRIGTEQGILLGGVEIEATTLDGPAVRVIEAQVSIRWQGPDSKGPPLFMGTIGLFKIPFGFEVPELDPQRFFLERSTMGRALFPGTYDLGFRVQGGYRFVRYALALTNGEPIGEKSFPGRDPNGAKDFVGRVGVDAALSSRIRLQAGLSGLVGTGFHQGTPTTKDVLVWRDANEDGLVQLSEIQVIPGAPSTPSQSFSRFAVGADLRLSARLPVLGDLTVSGEVARAQNLDRGVEPADPVGAGRDLRELGFHVGLTQELTRYGMIGVRYDRYDPDADASEQRGVNRVPRDSTYAMLAVTGAVRYAPGRLLFEYDHRTNALGRTPAGLPTTLADDAFTLRGEVTF